MMFSLYKNVVTLFFYFFIAIQNYPADNLLKTDGYKKWKSGSVGEKQLSVTLQVSFVQLSLIYHVKRV